MDKGFCEKCNKLVKYEIKEIDEIIEIKGKNYKYKKLLGYCKTCGEEISSNEINDENLERIDKVYRSEENKRLISERTYNNVKKAIKEIKGRTFKNGDEKEIEIIAEYIITTGKETTPLALQKILYYAQGFYKAFFGKFLFMKTVKLGYMDLFLLIYMKSIKILNQLILL